MSRDYTIERSKPVDPALQFLSVPREYVLLNSTDSDIEIQWDGETRTIPKGSRVSGRGDHWGPAKDSNGDLIPGTLVLQDIFQMDTTFGSEVMIWSAANCIKNVLGIDVKTGAATGAYAKRGLSLLPSNPDPETVARIREAGRGRYEEWRLVDARTLINAFDERNVARARVGMPAVPPPPEYQEAVFFLQAYSERQKAAVVKTLTQSISHDELIPPVTVSSYDSVEGTDHAADTAGVPQDSGQAEPAPVQSAPQVDREALIEQLLQDEEFLKTLRARAIMAGGKKKKA